jgi:hypothetical protein
MPRLPAVQREESLLVLRELRATVRKRGLGPCSSRDLAILGIEPLVRSGGDAAFFSGSFVEPAMERALVCGP